jgi:hypothetical protein
MSDCSLVSVVTAAFTGLAAAGTFWAAAAAASSAKASERSARAAESSLLASEQRALLALARTVATDLNACRTLTDQVIDLQKTLWTLAGQHYRPEVGEKFQREFQSESAEATLAIGVLNNWEHSPLVDPVKISQASAQLETVAARLSHLRWKLHDERSEMRAQIVLIHRERGMPPT